MPAIGETTSASVLSVTHDWLVAAREQIAGVVGEDPALDALGEDDVTALLDLARIAAHTSGDRRNAPLVTYLLGLARGRNPEQSLASLVEAIARSKAASTGSAAE